MDTLTAGFASSEAKSAQLRKEIGEVKKDTEDAKTLAAKATTLASETKDSLQNLEKRWRHWSQASPQINQVFPHT